MMQIANHQVHVGRVIEVGVSADNSSAESAAAGSLAADERSHETLSSLAQRLHAAEQLAAVRDSQLTRRELAALAASIREKVYGASYDFNKTTHDAEAPNSDDAQWIASARQATDFLNGRGDNPFFAMSSLQLSLIAYDEGGSFTVNERQAAMVESGRQYGQWSKYVVDKIWSEYQLTGKSTQGSEETLAYYKSLPAIEESRYGSYETDIMLQLSFPEIERPEFNTSLLDMLANGWQPALEREGEASNVDTSAPTRLLDVPNT